MQLAAHKARSNINITRPNPVNQTQHNTFHASQIYINRAYNRHALADHTVPPLFRNSPINPFQFVRKVQEKDESKNGAGRFDDLIADHALQIMNNKG